MDTTSTMPDYDALYGLMVRRQSVRQYGGEPLPRAQVRRLVAAAIRAPSAHNRQPWRFVVLDDRARREALARAMGERLQRDRLFDGDDPERVARDVARSVERITQAPTAILVALDMQHMDAYPDARRRENEYIMAVQSVALAVGHLLLAAEAEGLGACWLCAPLFASDTVLAALDLPRDWQAQALITLGQPAEPGRDRDRLPIDDVLLTR